MDAKKATLEELLRRKMQSENDRNAFFPVESKEIGLTFMVQKLPIPKIIDMLDDFKITNGETSTKENFEGAVRIIYESVPMLHDEKLRKGLTEPYDVVPVVFGDNIGAIVDFAQAIIEKFYVGAESAVQEIKN
ncbi:MAG: hypothetical protein ACLUAK_06905 [Dialister invisus]|uniref:hypothetical protein n=1 Tax=Dialister invisus TaxID=218538 RepID=UPI002674F4DD|nr:hypothetical protein [Dialister invisus]